MESAPLAIALLLLGAATPGAQPGKDWQSVFPVDKKTLGVKGSNPYFILTPGYQLSYKNGNDTDTVTVLNETKVIDGVETRVVEDLASFARPYLSRLWARLHGRDVWQEPCDDVDDVRALLEGVARSVSLDHRQRIKAMLELQVAQ